jgi:hypothetical protein
VCSRISNLTLILHIPAVGIPLPANFNKQSEPQIDDNDPLSSGDSETYPFEASNLLASGGGGGGGAGAAFLTGIICCPLGYLISQVLIGSGIEMTLHNLIDASGQ